jgi:flagellar hook-basal body complex protein FliE
MKMGEISMGFITPMKPWKWTRSGVISTNDSNAKTGSSSAISGSGQIPFQNVFQTAVEQVKETQADVENKQYLLSTGQLEDAHTLPIAETKAQISLDMMISLRNKALESYNELIKMNI